MALFCHLDDQYTISTPKKCTRLAMKVKPVNKNLWRNGADFVELIKPAGRDLFSFSEEEKKGLDLRQSFSAAPMCTGQVKVTS